MLFASRLHNLLSYYLRSREVSDFESLVNLLVSDKLKSCLPMGSLNYVLSLEGNDWFEPSKVASLADTFTTNHESLNIRGPQTQQPKQPRFPQPRQFVPPRARAPAPSRWYSGSYQERPEGNSAGRGRGQSHHSTNVVLCVIPPHILRRTALMAEVEVTGLHCLKAREKPKSIRVLLAVIKQIHWHRPRLICVLHCRIHLIVVCRMIMLRMMSLHVRDQMNGNLVISLRLMLQ